MANSALSILTKQEIAEFMRRLGRAGFNAELIHEVIQSDGDELARAMYCGLVQNPSFAFVHDLFRTPERQIRTIRQWSQEFGWNIPPESFAEAARTIPAWPEEKLVAVVLVPYLTDIRENHELVMTGMERTFRELSARFMAGHKEARTMCNSTDANHLRLYPSGRHRPGLFWEVIDLGSHPGKAIQDVHHSPVEPPPGAGVLAAAALHPEWVRSMSHEGPIPFVWFTGYQYNVPTEGLWGRAPLIEFDARYGIAEITCYWASAHWGGTAVPTFFSPGARTGRTTNDSRKKTSVSPKSSASSRTSHNGRIMRK